MRMLAYEEDEHKMVGGEKDEEEKKRECRSTRRMNWMTDGGGLERRGEGLRCEDGHL